MWSLKRGKDVADTLLVIIPAAYQSERVDVALVCDLMSLVTAAVILLAQMPQPTGATQFRNL